MKRLLGGFIAAALLGLLPFATAQEPAKEQPAAAKAPPPGAAFFDRFDLNKDGKVDWEEFQKVKSGFAALDADRDGAITPTELAKFLEGRRDQARGAMRRRAMRRMHPGWQGRRMEEERGPRGGAREGPPPWAGRPMGPWGQGSWRGQRGPGPGFGAGAWQRRGRGGWWGFGAPDPDEPEAPRPPPRR
jgi:hypothetical protein